MEFSSLIFIYGFLPLSIALYYAFPVKHRDKLLLLISAVFCAAQSLYFLGFTAVYTLFNFLTGKAVEASGDKKRLSAAVLSVGIAADLSAFILLKSETFSGEVPILGFIGISFMTMSAVGYLADIYRGRIKAEKNIMRFALFIIFFPKLPLGPPLSYSSFTGMLRKKKTGLSEIGTGLGIFMIGLAKKVIFADNIYQLYSAVSSAEVRSISALSAWLGAFAYMLSLYFSLSGIADMGIGASRCFGIKMPQSFNYPVFSMGIRDFCIKWHIPAVRWIKHYIITPFTAVSKKKKWQTALITIAAWGIFGLWYELSLNKLIWGLFIGTALVIESNFSSQKGIKAASVVYTLFVMLLCWVFFFGDSLSYSLHYLIAMIGGNNNIADSVSLYLLKYYAVLLLAGAYGATDLFRNLIIKSKKIKLRKAMEIISPVCWLALLIICTALISYSGTSEMLLLKM